MSIETSEGTCIAVSLATPATHDEVGFKALTFTQIGELENIGDLVRAKTQVSFTNMCTGKTSVKKGAEEASTLDINAALDRADAGQLLMDDAYDQKGDVAFKVTENHGAGPITYFRASVLRASVRFGSGPNDVKRAAYQAGIVVPNNATSTFIETPGP